MKIRLDQYLVQHGLTQSRERAKALIMSGIVFVNEQKVDKAGEMIKEDAKVEVRGRDRPEAGKSDEVFSAYTQWQGLHGHWSIYGGFTDCMLQNGAVKVYAVDVGYGQLAWSLRTDERVVNMERTNIRNVKPEDLAEQIEFFSVDVSFISLHIFSRWHRQSQRRMPWAFVWSSRSLKLDAKGWQERCGARPCYPP